MAPGYLSLSGLSVLMIRRRKSVGLIRDKLKTLVSEASSKVTSDVMYLNRYYEYNKQIEPMRGIPFVNVGKELKVVGQ